MTTADPPVGAEAPAPAAPPSLVAPEDTSVPPEPESVKPGLRIGLALGFIVASVLIYLAAPLGIVQQSLPLFLAATLAVMAPLFLSRKFDPFTPACYYAMVNGVIMVSIIAAFFTTEEVSFGGLPRLGYDERVDLLNEISLAYIVQSTGYCLGYYFTGGFKRVLQILPSFPNFQWNSRRLWLVIGGLWLTFAVAYARFQSLAKGGLFDVATAETKAVWRTADDRMAWLFRSLQLGMVPLYALTARFIARSSNDRARPKWMLVLLFLAATITLLASRIGQRGFAIIMVIGLATIVHFVWRRIPTPVILAAGFVAIVGTNYLGDARVNTNNLSTRASSNLPRPVQVLARLEDDRDHLTASGCAMYYFPERHDYLKGSSFVSILLFPIPSSIWPEKSRLFPMSENGIVWQLLQVPVPMPFPFVLYANFGWIGMLVGMALWGAFHKTLFKWVHQSGYKPAVVAIYAPVLVTFSPTSSGIASLLGSALPLFILMKLMKRA